MPHQLHGAPALLQRILQLPLLPVRRQAVRISPETAVRRGSQHPAVHVSPSCVLNLSSSLQNMPPTLV